MGGKALRAGVRVVGAAAAEQAALGNVPDRCGQDEHDDDQNHGARR